MSILKLISQGKAYDELFDTVDYIQTDDGVGIYPAYENALRLTSSATNTVLSDFDAGSFIINVPTGQSAAIVTIPNSALGIDTSYDIYLQSGAALDQILVQAYPSPLETLYINENPTTEEAFNITTTSSTSTRLLLYPVNKDENITINLTIVLKGYPKIQTWGGSGLSKTFLLNENSVSLSFNNFTGNSTYDLFLENKDINNKPIFDIVKDGGSTSKSRVVIRVYVEPDFVTKINTTITISDMDILTINKNNSIVTIYNNKTLVKTVITNFDTAYDSLHINSNTNTFFDINQIVISTEVSTGYPAGTNISIIPTCKLGLTGSEIDLPKESRMQSSVNRVVKELESESANATLHTQFIATKDRLSVSYDVISEENTKLIKDIEALQWQNNTRLSYIYNEESGNLITKTVKAKVITGGNKLLRDKYFDGGLTIEMKE